MKDEFEKHFQIKYPRMIDEKFWGFECSDGWYNILDQLMSNIQHHIDWKEKQRDWTIRFNSTAPPEDVKPVPDAIPQVTLDQVKEKFGTLRFYYTGGDAHIDGMVTMAESISGITCEVCGNLGESHGGGWVKTLCTIHKAEVDARRQERLKNEI